MAKSDSVQERIKMVVEKTSRTKKRAREDEDESNDDGNDSGEHNNATTTVLTACPRHKGR